MKIKKEIFAVEVVLMVKGALKFDTLNEAKSILNVYCNTLFVFSQLFQRILENLVLICESVIL